MKYIYILVLFFPILLNSQNFSRINYIVVPTGGSFERNEKIMNSSLSSRFLGVDDALKKLNYELLINEDNSYFHLISNLNLNEKASRTARIIADCSEYFNINKEGRIIEVVDFLGQTLNVLLNVNHKWELINETKDVNGYTCYKAILEKRLMSGKLIKVIAWYCPSIPLPFGPKEFANLPGLIMELQDGYITYLVSKIEMNQKSNIKIKNIKGELISVDDFKKILVKHDEDIMNNKG